jgi:uncharacterized protein YjbI with pentapeptide repeats
MSTSTNDTLRQAPDRVRQIITQWNRFNQRLYLQAELGKQAISFADFFNGIIGYPAKWDTDMEPGKKAGTSIEPLRNMNIDDIDFRELIGDTPLNYFPMALLKPGQSFAANDPARFDISTCKGSSFYKISSLYLYAPFVNFLGCLFEDSHFKFPHLYQTQFTACTLENCTFDQGYFNANGADGSVIEWRNVLIRKCQLQSPVMTKIKFVSSTIEDSQLSGGNFRHYDNGIDAVTPTMRNSRFDSSQWNIRTGPVGKIVGCDFQNSLFYGPDEISGYIVGNNFSYCQFQGAVKFNFFCQYNDFRNAWFFTKPVFEDNCSLVGCDFSGSNIDVYWSKTQIADLLGSGIDSSTIWTDGTPF